jgi:hypothetical protein
MNTTIVIVAYAALLSAVSTTVLMPLGHAAHGQTEGGCPTDTNTQGLNCANPHDIHGGPPFPSCASSLVTDGSDACRFNPPP